MLRRLDTKVILVAVAAFLIVKARGTYLLFNLLELQNRASFQVVGVRHIAFPLTSEAAIERTIAAVASAVIAGHSGALTQAKAALEQGDSVLWHL
jgi:hypothetical protein